MVQCESNLLGITNGAGRNVGSGGWSNIVHKYAKAKLYCSAPFEVRRRGTRNVRVPIEGEWIGEKRGGQRRKVAIRCASATSIDVSPESLDAVFTDPSYYGNVQYSELMDFCYVWLRRLVGNEADGFERALTRSLDELNGNVTRNHGLDHFTEGLSAAYSRMAQALKPGAPLAFTYHHNKLETYHAVGVAILDADLVVSATLPCPAEMGGSIHIHGNGFIDHRYRVRLPGVGCSAAPLDIRHARTACSNRGGGFGGLGAGGQKADPRRHPLYRLRPSHTYGHLEAPPALGQGSADS